MKFIFIIVCAENDQEWSRKISSFHKTEDEYLHRLSTTNNEIPGAVAAVNILFMS